MNALGMTLIWCALQVTAFVTVAGLLYVLVRRLSPATGGLITAAGLMGIIVISGLAFSPWPHWDWTAPNKPRSADLAPSVIPNTESVASNEATTQPANPPVMTEESFAIWLAEMRAALALELSSATETQPQSRPQWTAIVGVVFLLGFGLGLVRLVGGLWTVRSFRRVSTPVDDVALRELADTLGAELGCRREIALFEAKLLTSPATVGWRRPVVLLPTAWRSWTQQERRAVLAHEIAHIRRGDFVIYVMAQLGLLLHFYHPLVHWLTGRLRLEQELAADATAAALAGGRTAYLQTLAAMALRQADQSLGWPARTFLPTRGHLLRRVEMLKHSKRFSTPLSAVPRVILVAVLAVVGIGIVGLRGPEEQFALAEDPKVARKSNLASVAATKPKSDKIELAYIPADAMFVVAIRPAAIFQQPGLRPLAKMLNVEHDLQDFFGVPVEEIEQITLMLGPSLNSQPNDQRKQRRTTIGGLMIRAIHPAGFKQADNLLSSVVEVKYLGQTYYKSAKIEHGYFRPDERTIIAGNEATLRQFIASGPRVKAKIVQGSSWNEMAKNHFAIAVDSAALTNELNSDPKQGLGMLQVFAPLWEQSDSLIGGGKLGAGLTIHGMANCTNEPNARQVQETIVATVTILKNLLQRAPAGSPEAKLLVETGTALLDSAKITQNGTTVQLSSKTTTETGRAVMAGMTLVQSARGSARKLQARNSLKQIAIAMHNYHDAYGHFPSAVLIDRDGKTLHSWRVALLPFVGHAKLYQEYRRNEPWDSEHNKKLLKKMPAIFRHPVAPNGSTNSSYFLITGKNTLFGDSPKSLFVDTKSRVNAFPKISNVRDGTSNTLLAVEAKRDIPWTKPEDILYDPNGPIPKFGGHTPGKFVAVLVAGNVIQLPDQGIEEKLWRAVITHVGGETEGGVKLLERADKIFQGSKSK